MSRWKNFGKACTEVKPTISGHKLSDLLLSDALVDSWIDSLLFAFSVAPRMLCWGCKLEGESVNIWMMVNGGCSMSYKQQFFFFII